MDIAHFIVTYFTAKSLSMITVYTCWTPDTLYRVSCTSLLLEHVGELWRCARDAGVRLNVHQDFTRLPDMAPSGLAREGVLLDVTCPDAARVLYKASSTRAFSYRHSWILLHNSSYNRFIVSDYLANVSILPDADVIWSSPDNLVDVYIVKVDRPYTLTELGLTRNCTREDLTALWARLPTAVTRIKNLGGVYLKAVVVLTQPQHFKGWSDLRDRQIDTYPKVTYPLMMLTTQDLNYRLAATQVDSYGSERNGSFSGLAGRLQRARAELGVASMFMRVDRMRALHYVAETVTLTSAFIFRQPARSAVSNVFVAPFSGGVWAACGALAALAAALLAAMCRLHAAAGAGAAHLTLPDACTFALATMCQQGFHVTPAVTSVRIVMFCTLLTSLFVFTAYSATVVAILQTPSDAIRTLDQLASSPMALGVQETTYKKVYFAESSEPATQRLYRRKLVPLGERAYLSVVDGIARVRRGLFAFQVESSPAYDVITKTFTEREKCSLREIEAFKLPTVALPIRRHSGYRELFATRLRWQREVGLLGRERRRWLCGRPRCEAGAGGGFLTVGLADVMPALQMLSAGAALATLLLLAELAAHALLHNTKYRFI